MGLVSNYLTHDISPGKVNIDNGEVIGAEDRAREA
jgi:hypothetical protein